ncbi:transposable element Tcb1 transposase [Trichonephila clavipes]|nr:transposable element Tcb1 transposase [Trichonephila clavipes]
MSRRKHRSAFDQVSELDRGRIVTYRNCGLSFREIGNRVGRNQTTVRRICDRWMQEGTTDRRGQSYPPQCTTSREDRQIVRMAVTDRSVTSRTVAQHIESVMHHSVSARTIQCHLQQSGLCARRPLLGLPLTRRTTDVSTANGTMKEGYGWQNGMKLSLLTNHASVCNATIVGFESGDTVERGCWTALLCTATLVLHSVLWYGAVLDITLTLFYTHCRYFKQPALHLRVLEPVVLPYLQGLATAIFQQDNVRPHMARIVQRFFVNHQIELLP